MPTAVFKVPPVDYSDRDYISIRTRLISLIPYYTPEWTDYNADDLGIVLLELFSYIGDVLHYYVDRNAAEGFLDSAITESAHRSFWKLIDYTPTGSVPAVVTLTFTEPAAASTNHTIPAGTRCDTSSIAGDIITFETDSDAIIAKGTTSVSASATQGITMATSTNREVLGVSDGNVFQSYQLLSQPTIDSTVRIWVDEGSSTYFEYFAATDFASADPDDRVFKLVKTEDNFTRVVFGDSTTGKVPPSGGSIEAAYRVGGGLAGNVGANTISVIVDSLGFTVAVTNAAAASGGSSPETIKEQKEQGPLSLKTLERAVTQDDYRSRAKLIDGVYDAYAYYHAPSATARVSIAPSGGGLPNTALKTLVEEDLDSRNCLGTEVEVVDPLIIPIDIIATVILQTTASRTTVSTAVDAALEEFLSFGTSDNTSVFGTDIFTSDVIRFIDEQDGVDHVDVSKLCRDPQPIIENFSDQNATITITTGSENDVEQVITIQMDKDASQSYEASQTAGYSVTGSISGVLATNGVASTTDPTAVSISDGNVHFSIAIQLAVNSPIGPYDSFYFTIGKYYGNQTISDNEIPDAGTLSLTYTGGTA